MTTPRRQATIKLADPPAVDIGREDFQAFYQSHNRMVYHFFIRRGLSREESRDLTQETFLQAFKSRASFRGEALPGTWLCGVATRVLSRHNRDQQRDKRHGDEVSIEDLADQRRLHLVERRADDNPTLRAALTDERVRLVQSAIAELPDRMRACLRLHVDQGLKYAEIAAALKVSEGTVKSQVSEARTRIKDRLDQQLSHIPTRRTP